MLTAAVGLLLLLLASFADSSASSPLLLRLCCSLCLAVCFAVGANRNAQLSFHHRVITRFSSASRFPFPLRSPICQLPTHRQC